MKLTPQKFSQVKSYIQRKRRPNFNHVVVRATLLKGGRILREYDFLQRKMFDRRLAKSNRVYKRTIQLLQEYFQGNYDPNTKMRKSFWDRFKSFFGVNNG